MSIKKLKKEIEKLELAEKLMLVEDIWDSIVASNSQLPIPEWQKKVLDKRYEEYKLGNEPSHDWKEVHEELRKKYK